MLKHPACLRAQTVRLLVGISLHLYQCPHRNVVLKNSLENFWEKSVEIFHTPPSALRAPSRGGSARTPGGPPSRGTPPKKGSPLPPRISRQNSPKKGRNRAKMGIFGGFWPQNVHFFVIFEKFSKVSGELCREKNALRRRLSAVQKPANLYSTKCRFFGPPPPPGGYQCTECTSRGSRGPSPLGPAQARSPPSLPERLFACCPCRW